MGKDWYDVYFGQNGIFQDRTKLLDMLRSDKTTNAAELLAIGSIMQTAEVAGQAGFSFNGIDAIGLRLSASASAVIMGSGSADAVLNLTAGQFSVFVSPEAGVMLGESATVVGGLLVIGNLPNNEAYNGPFGVVGVTGGDVVGLTAEGFWSSPMTDRFDPRDKAHGAFLGAGAAVPSIGVYGAISYSFEALRVDQGGDTWWPNPPTGRQILTNIADAVTHDICLNPIWPWSPYR